MDKVFEWIKGNKLLAGLGALAIVLLFFPKVLRGIFGSSPRRRHRRNVHKAITGTYRRRRRVRRNKPAVRRRRTTTHRRGTGKKKPWQIKGSLAAKRYMARLRRRR